MTNKLNPIEGGFMESFLESITDAVVIYSPGHNVLYVNRAFEKIYGWTQEEVLGVEMSNNPFILEAEKGLAKQRLDWIQSGEPAAAHARIRKKDGGLADVSIALASIRDRNGTIIALSSVHRDITESKKAERLINEAKEEQELIWNHTEDAMFLIAYDGTKIKINPAFEVMFGWAEGEVRGALNPPYIPAGFREEYQRLIERLKAGESFSNLSQQRLRKDGKTIDVLVSYKAVNKGRILAVGTYKDITEKKKFQHALIQNKERYKKLLHAVPDAIIVVTDGTLVYANPAGINLLHAESGAQLLGTSIFDRFHPTGRDRETIITYMRNVLNSEEPEQSGIDTIIGLDGAEIEVEMIGISVIYEEKPSIQFVIRDLTGRHQAERALEESEARYRLIAENMTDLIMVVDPDGIISICLPLP